LLLDEPVRKRKRESSDSAQKHPKGVLTPGSTAKRHQPSFRPSKAENLTQLFPSSVLDAKDKDLRPIVGIEDTSPNGTPNASTIQDGTPSS
jgi:hypothetical protein